MRICSLHGMQPTPSLRAHHRQSPGKANYERNPCLWPIGKGCVFWVCWNNLRQCKSCWIGYMFSSFGTARCVGVCLHGQSVGQVKMIGSSKMGQGTKTLRFPTFSTVSIDTFKCFLQNWFYFGQQEQLQVVQKNTFTNNRCFMKQLIFHQHWPLTPFFTLEPPCHALQAPVVMVVAKIPHCIPWVNIWGNGAKKTMTANNLGEHWLIQTEAVARMWDVFSFILNEYGTR